MAIKDSKKVGPNGETVVELARYHTAEAIERLARIMRGADDDLAMKASQLLLDRGWGRTKEMVELNANVSTVPMIQIVRASEAETARLN